MSDSQPASSITIDQFGLVDMRVGRIVRAEPFPKARKPAFKLWIDFGPLGVRQSSAQLTVRYTLDELLDRIVVAVVNLPPRHVADFRSEVLVLGATGPNGDVCLLQPSGDIPLGASIA